MKERGWLLPTVFSQVTTVDSGEIGATLFHIFHSLQADKSLQGEVIKSISLSSTFLDETLFLIHLITTYVYIFYLSPKPILLSIEIADL